MLPKASASRLVIETNRVACAYPDNAGATVGHLRVMPNSRNVVPGKVHVTLNVRNAKDETLLAMVAHLKASVTKIETECRCTIDITEILYFAPSHFDPELVDSVRKSAQALGLSCRDIVSGVAHDAVYLMAWGQRPMLPHVMRQSSLDSPNREIHARAIEM